MAWLEVSLTVNGEAAEAVADLLTRFAPDGVALRPLRFEQSVDSESATVSDEVVVSAYLPEGGDLENTRAQLEESLWHLGQLLPLPAPAYRPVAESDWSESWKANFHPLRVGKRLMIVPAWLHPELAPGDVEIRLDPGMAFGTGTHPSTQLCLKIIERHLAPGQAMIDLGCGSGILSIAAAKLGAGPILALDIAPEAVRVTAENTQANGVAGQVTVANASLPEVLAGQFGPAWRSTPLVVANILASILVPMLENGLAATMAPGGLLVLAGILDKQVYRILAALEAAGLKVVAQEQMEDWVAFIASKTAATASTAAAAPPGR
jgi:ribosomal protein L11 methyltransferase